jgi:hypothetical protein
MCAVTRGASGCVVCAEVLIGRGNRLVGDVDRAGCDSVAVAAAAAAVMPTEDGGPRLGGRHSGDLSRVT